MTTRLNRYYNNPNIGAAASNLASLFAPPSPQDMLAYSTVQQQQAEEQRIADFLGMGAGADPLQLDIHGAAAGLYSPNQGFNAVNMGDATDRFGHQLDYDASTGNNRRDNQRALETNRLTTQAGLVGDMFGPLNPGQARPSVPENVMGVFDLPGLDAEFGLDKPMSVDETVAANMDPETARILGLSDIPIETILDENSGAPAIVPRGMAWGQEPHIAQGSKPAMQRFAYQRPDGTQGMGVFDPEQGIAFDEATRTRLPQGTIPADVVDTVEGLGKATMGRAERAVMDIDLALDTARRFETLVSQAPLSGGLAGGVRGFLQDLAATGGELSQLAAQINQSADEVMNSPNVDQEVKDLLSSIMFDTNIPARQALAIMTATQVAKAQSPERVSNELISQIQKALGEGYILSNTQRTGGGVGAIISDLESRRGVLEQYVGPGVPPAAPSNNAPPPPAAAPAGTARGVPYRILD